MTDEQAVKDANAKFYAALESLDIKKMESVWLPEKWVKCVHPGWHLLSGWKDIKESWEMIFSNTRFIRVRLTEIFTRVEGDFAWVACTENITSSHVDEEEFHSALAQATNLFVRRGAKWLMVQHHASPLPSQVDLQQVDSLQ